MVNWRPIGIVLIVIGILMAIVGGGLLYWYRLDPFANTWWMWAVVGLGIVLAIAGAIAAFFGNRKEVVIGEAAVPLTVEVDASDGYFSSLDSSAVPIVSTRPSRANATSLRTASSRSFGPSSLDATTAGFL